MEAAKYLEVIGCDVHKPSRFQVNYQLIHHGKRYDFINGLVLSNWTVYHPQTDNLDEGKVFEFNEKQMVDYIFENFIEEFRDSQLTKILE
jgi:hypothetical protein